jgi:hypothetical protein
MQYEHENPKIENHSDTEVKKEISVPKGLFFNILPFQDKREPVPVTFTFRNDPGKERFSTRWLPVALQQKLRTDGGELPEFVYSGLNEDTEGFKVNIDFASCPSVARAWYTHKIRERLAVETDYYQSNFLKDTQFWCPDEAGSNAHWHSFHKFTLRVQTDYITGGTELLISYDGHSYILKQSMADLRENGEWDTRMVKTVAFRKRIYSYEKRPNEALYAPDEVFPLLNREIAVHLKQNYPFAMISNKYDLFYRQVEWFYTKYCSDPLFSSVIPHSGQWKQAAAESTGRMAVSDRQLVFGQGNKGVDVYYGIRDFGPAILPPGKHFTYFFIYFEHQEDAAHKLYNYLLKKEGHVRMDKFTRLPLHYEKEKNLVIQKGENPEMRIQEYMQNTSFDKETVYFAFYISPYTRFEANELKKRLYYRIKEMLLYRNISMQTVEGHKLSHDFSNSMASIGSAMIAKLGGIPWRLEGTDSMELVIGFGAYRNKGFNMGYTGSAISFSQDGMFREFGVFPAENTRSIAGSALKAFKQYRENYPEAQRMIIHFYKPMSRKELEPLEIMLKELKMDIPVVIAGISMTPSKRLLLFDNPEEIAMPVDGTWAKIGRAAYLLNINLRKQESLTKVMQTMPLRIQFQCNR